MPYKQYKRKTRTKTRRKTKGGKLGTLTRIMDYEGSPIIGAGGYGIVLDLGNGHREAIKLFKHVEDCKAIGLEARIQNRCYELFLGTEIYVPKLTFYRQSPIKYRNVPYLCGIGMEYLPPPLDFEEQVHMVLGYEGNDIDSSWGTRMSEPVSSENPTRGFFASADTMESIWKQEGSSMNLDKMSYLMGKGFRTIIDAGIIPIDIEWVWSKGKPWMIDFGLCQEGKVNPEEFLLKGGSEGLGTDIYWPRNKEFYRGYFNSSGS